MVVVLGLTHVHSGGGQCVHLIETEQMTGKFGRGDIFAGLVFNFCSTFCL